MAGRRFRALETPRTVQYAGVITLDELRKKFNIPPQARVYVKGMGSEGWREDQIEIDSDTPVRVEWQAVK